MAQQHTSNEVPGRARIASLAYELYEAEGRPTGRDVAHWLRAERLVQQQSGPSGPAGPESPQRREEAPRSQPRLEAAGAQRRI